MAKAATGSRRRRNRRRGSGGQPGTFVIGVLLLLGAGLGAWYFRGALDTGFAPPARTASAENKEAAPGGTKPAGDEPAPEAPATEAADRFEFYEMLPDAEVEVSEQSKPAGPGSPPLVSVPGTYVVQAGAFPDFAEADKVKARLALLGVVSEIQAAEANGATFHRVRIGPIENLNELNRLRARLRQNGIEYLVIPVGE